MCTFTTQDEASSTPSHTGIRITLISLVFNVPFTVGFDGCTVRSDNLALNRFAVQDYFSNMEKTLSYSFFPRRCLNWVKKLWLGVSFLKLQA